MAGISDGELVDVRPRTYGLTVSVHY